MRGVCALNFEAMSLLNDPAGDRGRTKEGGHYSTPRPSMELPYIYIYMYGVNVGIG